MRILTVALLIALTLVGSTTAQKGGGRFKVEYPKTSNPDYERWRKELQEGQVLEKLAADLNSTFNLPVDITLSFTECKEANAFYDPERKRIELCYELIDQFYDDFSKETTSPEVLEEQVVNATIFVFYHELGHAFVDVFQIPITGKEEDAVDQLATYIMLDGTPEGAQAVIDAAVSFYSENEDESELPFWDEHSLGKQRFYNIICWTYGHNEQAHNDLVKQGVLPQERAERCSGEYEQLANSWSKLLAPHLKK